MAVHGKGSSFNIDDIGTTQRDLSSFLNNIDFPQDAELADDTAFGDSSRSFVVGLKGASITLDGHFTVADNEADDVLADLYSAGTNTPFEYWPAGTGASKVVYYGNGIVENHTITGNVGDLITFSTSIRVSGNVTRSTT